MSEIITVQDLETLKKHEIFEAEVITGKVGGLAAGADTDYATNQVTGQVQKTMPAILRDIGFTPAAFDFTSGGTLGVNDRDKAVLWPLPGGDGDWYYWEGALPKVIPAASTPYTTGGVADGAWRPVGDITFRGDIAASNGASLVGFIQGGSGAVPRTAQDKMREVVSVTDFGVVGDGVAIENAQLTAAASYANTHNLKLICPSGLRIKLTGTDAITFQTDVDFNNSVLDVSGFAGLIKFMRRELPVEYGPTSSVVTALQVDAQLTGKAWTGWNGVAEVEDSFVIIETSQPFYTFRGVTQNRTELNKVNRYGMVESALKYPLDPDTITKITVYPIEKKWTTAENIVFDIGNNDLSDSMLHIENSLFRLKNWRFLQGDFVNANKNPVYVRVANSCHVHADGVYFQWANRSTSSSGFTYNIAPELSYDLKFSNLQATGDGWGAMAGNICRKLTFDKCNMSRIDFHHPFQELLHIKDCDIGSWGVLVTALGDLVIEGGSMTIEQQVHINNQGFVRSREDSGGFCDGNLIIRNVSLRDETVSDVRRLVQHQFTSGNPKPSGSPITYQFWNTVLIDAVSYVGGVLQLLPGVTASSGISYPDAVSIINCLNGLFYIEELGFGGIAERTPLTNTPVNSPATNSFNVVISVINSRSRSIRLREQGTQRFAISLKVAQLHGRRDGPSCLVELVCGGAATFIDSEIEGFDFFSGTALDKRLKISFKGGVIRHSGAENASTLLNGYNSFSDVSVSDAAVQAGSAAILQTILQATLRGNTYYAGNNPASAIFAIADFSTATQPLTNSALSLDNVYKLLTGFDGDNTAKVTPIVIPTPGKTHYYQISATQSVSLARSSDGLSITATVTGGAAARYIYLA